MFSSGERVIFDKHLYFTLVISNFKNYILLCSWTLRQDLVIDFRLALNWKSS